MKRFKHWLKSLFKKKPCPHCVNVQHSDDMGFDVMSDPAIIHGEFEGYDEKPAEHWFHIDARTKTLNYFCEYEDGSGADDWAWIHYCPMCGRKL